MKIHELLDKPNAWIKNNLAMDRYGDLCPINSDRAASWCIIGALSKCYSCAEIKELFSTKLKNSPFESSSALVDWNDSPTTTYEMVYNLVKALDV